MYWRWEMKAPSGPASTVGWHVQGAGKTRLLLDPIRVAVLKPEVARLMGGRTDCRFLAADGWIEALHVRVKTGGVAPS